MNVVHMKRRSEIVYLTTSLIIMYLSLIIGAQFEVIVQVLG